MFKICEIFRSIQGEGLDVGAEAGFIRFAGCNQNCSWCDTDFANGTEMMIQQILAEIKGMKVDYVVLTGGEPLIQDMKLLKVLVDKLHDLDIVVAVETNGTIIPDFDEFDVVSISPKLSSSGNDPYEVDKLVGLLSLDASIQVKFVIASREDMVEAVELLRSVGIHEGYYENIVLVFQPEFNSQVPMMDIADWWKELGVEVAEGLAIVRFIPQVHKLMGVR